MKRIKKFQRVIIFFFFVFFSNISAWGPHDRITGAALKVLPHFEKIKNTLEEKNFNLLPTYSWIPDQRGQDLKSFYADDYILTKELPHYIDHRMPDVKKAIEPHFKRALQALKTETPTEACRWLGPLLHYVEDIGAPPHAMRISGPEHAYMENWVKPEMIDITGYTPVLLGKTDQEALKGLMDRLDKLVAFSVERGQKMLPLVKKGESERPKVEPLVLECAIETAKVVADTLYTLFTLGLQGKDEGAGVKGVINFPEFPFHKEKGARIILLDNYKYSKLLGSVTEGELLYLSSTEYSTHTDKDGRYEFRNLPEGEYRLLVERVGAQTKISDPIKLEKGKFVTLNLSLSPTTPPRNFVRNSDFKVYSYSKEMPDWWFKKTPAGMLPRSEYSTSVVLLPSNTSLRCGGILKNSKTKLHFHFKEAGQPGETFTIQNKKSENGSGEILYKTKEKEIFAFIVIETEKSLREAVECVWISEDTD